MKRFEQFEKDISKVKVSEHAFLRQIERIYDIPDNKSQKQFLNLEGNKEKLETEIKKELQYAKLIYVGQINNNETKNVHYYLNGDIAILFDNSTSTIITLYKIRFDLPLDSSILIKGYYDSLMEMETSIREDEDNLKLLNSEHEEYKQEINHKINEYKEMIKDLENQKEMLDLDYKTRQDKITTEKAKEKRQAYNLFAMHTLKEK